MGGDICFVTNILPNIFLCVQQNKEIYTGLEQLEGETEFSFLGEVNSWWKHSIENCICLQI